MRRPLYFFKYMIANLVVLHVLERRGSGRYTRDYMYNRRYSLFLYYCIVNISRSEGAVGLKLNSLLYAPKSQAITVAT